eukprot:scaffold451_cov365-Prasinococcus_capsulatus_cf.AAC.29
MMLLMITTITTTITAQRPEDAQPTGEPGTPRPPARSQAPPSFPPPPRRGAAPACEERTGGFWRGGGRGLAVERGRPFPAPGARGSDRGGRGWSVPRRATRPTAKGRPRQYPKSRVAVHALSRFLMGASCPHDKKPGVGARRRAPAAGPGAHGTLETGGPPAVTPPDWKFSHRYELFAIAMRRRCRTASWPIMRTSSNCKSLVHAYLITKGLCYATRKWKACS